RRQKEPQKAMAFQCPAMRALRVLTPDDAERAKTTRRLAANWTPTSFTIVRNRADRVPDVTQWLLRPFRQLRHNLTHSSLLLCVRSSISSLAAFARTRSF